MSDRLEIPIGDKKLVAKIYPSDGRYPDELSVVIEDSTGRLQQIICVIRQDFFTKVGYANKYFLKNSSVQLLVWEDINDEDYTSQLNIDLVDEKEENE